MSVQHRFAFTRMVTAAVALAALAGSASAQCSSWFQVIGPGPSPRQNHTMAYAGPSDHVLLFGGYRGGTGFNGETWRWDGEAWAQVLTAAAPSPRGNHAQAYDSVRRATVLFGGAVPANPGSAPNSETWEWANGAWTQASPATSPAARYNHAMAFDAARGQMVMFGGFGAVRYNDTWLYDGQNWTQASPATVPPARSSHAMVYDSVRQRIVMFGGFSGSWRNDLWEWDGTNWTQVNVTGPSGRQYLGMAFDDDRGVAILACGQQSGFVRADDTWEYNGSAWTQVFLGNVGIRDQHTMAYHPGVKQTILHGGYAGGANVLADTWIIECQTSCYPDCDTSTGVGVLDIFDFLCFQNRYSTASAYACDCDTSTGAGVCDIFDFLCFQNSFAQGCP